MIPAVVCPVCRALVDGALRVRLLAPSEGGFSCACGAFHPVIDGVAIVVRDARAFFASEGAEVLRRRDLPARTASFITDAAGGSLAKNERLRAIYHGSREGELQSWLQQIGSRLTGDVLEGGCGAGGLGRTDVVALDMNFGLLRDHPAATRVCGDLGDPPFLACAFDAVVLANVLDSCASPDLVLAQADALLKPGGTLVVTCPYAFSDEITPRDKRFTPEQLASALRGERPWFGHPLNYQLSEHHDGLEWPLVLGPRTRHVHSAQAIVAVRAKENTHP